MYLVGYKYKMYLHRQFPTAPRSVVQITTPIAAAAEYQRPPVYFTQVCILFHSVKMTRTTFLPIMEDFFCGKRIPSHLFVDEYR